jgi:Protein of unknown function (DUF2785)
MRAISIFALIACVSAAPGPERLHDLEFWRAIVHNHYAPPAGSDPAQLAPELLDALSSPDPEWRDEIAYATLASWIYQQKTLGAEVLRAMSERLLANLKHGIGEKDTDTVLARSFSALVLSVVVARDNADPFFQPDEWHRIEEAAIGYLAAEQDVRGYEYEKGWMHSAAHTADLIKFLGRSRYLDAAGQQRLLTAVSGKLDSAPVVFTFGEDERFARAILSLINRSDFDRRAFTAWLGRSTRLAERPTVADLRAIQNRKNVLAKLEVLLATGAQPSENAAWARDSVRGMLKDLF